MNYKKFALLSGIGVFIFMMGVFVGIIIVVPSYMQCENSLNNLCTYSNVLINISNIQSDIIEMCPICFDPSKLDLSRIKPLNCSLLKGGF